MQLRLLAALLVLVPCKGSSDAPSWKAGGNALCGPEDDPVQCGALCDFYFTTKQTLEGWADGTPLCGWPGVTCSGTQVTALDLKNKSLDGDIPASIGNLSNLARLDVSYNFVPDRTNFGSRGIPEEICKLVALQRLDISYNAFRGSLPACIASMSSLAYLIANHNNPLGGSIPDALGQLSMLEVLDMSHTQTTGSIPSSLGSLSSLRSLDLSHCILSGAIPDSLGQLKSMQSLNLTGNKFESWTTHSICNLIYEADLTDCNIVANPLSCPIPDCAPKCGATCIGSTVTV